MKYFKNKKVLVGLMVLVLSLSFISVVTAATGSARKSISAGEQAAINARAAATARANAGGSKRVTTQEQQDATNKAYAQNQIDNAGKSRTGNAVTQAQQTNEAPTATFSEYRALAPLDNGTGGKVDTNNFPRYINMIYKISIWVAGILAVVMIVIGGIEYMGSESMFGKGAGKEKIWNAIIGLVMILSCALILNTINPQLLNIDIHIRKVPNPEAAPTNNGFSNGLTVPTGTNSFYTDSAGTTHYLDSSGRDIATRKDGVLEFAQNGQDTLNFQPLP